MTDEAPIFGKMQNYDFFVVEASNIPSNFSTGSIQISMLKNFEIIQIEVFKNF